MKLFAPRNDWDIRSDQSWWGYVGGQPTVSGVRVNEETALTFSAWFAATRIVSETLASLPLNMLEQQDARTTRKAVDHSLYRILHDLPNPEQDIMTLLDGAVAFQGNWGNAFFEKQRKTNGELVALWPIHPSRVPLKNIVRNVQMGQAGWDQIEAGQPGEIVYKVSNDDGSLTPIPASDMLHIPGVLSQNGITGQSIVRWGSNSIGIGLATERHAGALFRNGAVTNMAIKSPKIVGKDTADRLRLQWQKVFAGVDNHYKTLILEEGMEPVRIDMDPEKAQLILARQFGVTEVARWWRLPPHMLADLSRSTNNNIEQQSLEFVIYSMVPWLVRWEKALYRQLLTAEEQKRFFFRFDVTELLRGDSAARAAYWKAMLEMGAASPNDVRAGEHMNPIPGTAGDVYFIPANNLMPLSKVEEYTQAQIDKIAASPPPPAPAAAPAKLPAGNADDQDGDADEPDDSLAELLRAVGKTATLEDLRDEVGRLLTRRETEESERLALREIEARKVAAAARDCLLLSLSATLEGWLGYESRAARRAAEKPQTFLTWRDEFYLEFRSKLAEALKPFAAAAEPIGFTFDAATAADLYVQQSVTSLESLADLPCNELAAGLEAVSETWSAAARPKQFAAELLKGTPCAS